MIIIKKQFHEMEPAALCIPKDNSRIYFVLLKPKLSTIHTSDKKEYKVAL